MSAAGSGYLTSVQAEGTDRLVAGRYLRRQPLGRGGFGVVWRAHDTLLRRDVAIKELEFPPILDEAEVAALREKVLREARAAARLTHPGAVTVFDVVQEDDRPFIVMELVDAPTLADVVASDGSLPDERAAAIGLDLLDTLAAAHAEGIVHRDVKPANVMINVNGRVQLADFGIASIVDDPKVTSSGAVAGSPSYMAPEQAQSLGTGPAVDLWGLGATLYFAVEGVPPFDKGAAIPTLTAVVNDPVRPMERSAALKPLIMDLLSKDPSARPSVAEVRRRLNDVVAGGAGGGVPAAPPAGTTVELERDLLPASGDGVAHHRLPPPPPPPSRPTPRPPRRRPPVAVVLTAIVAAAVVLALIAVLAGRDDRDPTPSQASDGGSGAATAPGEVPSDWVSYQDPETGFTISHPPGWTIRRNGTLTDFRDPATGAYLRVDYTRSPGTSPEADWEAFEPRFASENSGYRRIQITPTTYAGYRAAIWEFSYTSRGQELRAVDLGFIAGRYGFALNFQSAASDWERYQPVFDAFKASFRAPG
jgi:serine/threonine protein kinase